MQIHENFDLQPYNTFHVPAAARYFAAFQTADELRELLDEMHLDAHLILGGGSNVLFTQNFDGWVLKNEIRGVQVLREDDEFFYVQAGAGENWHQFVLHCLKHHYAGIENLSLIPGCVGAAPIQNIGAYGVELKDVFCELEALHLADRTVHRFEANECAFGYRDSVFKGRHKNQFAILNVTLRLRKQPIFHTSYGAIEQELEQMGVDKLSIEAISQAVINIRRSKLPDPAEIGNGGSFFKNPVLSREQWHDLQQLAPAAPSFASPDGGAKVPAAWLIDQCGWKGYRAGDAGVHIKQPLVLVNHGSATGREIFALSEEIRQNVHEKFGVWLEREVNVI